MIQTWRITQTQNIRLDVDASTLDEVTRGLADGFYSTFRTFDGGTRVLGLTHHLRRLYEPVSTPEVYEPFLRRQLSALLEAYRPGEARVRAEMTRQGQVYVAITPLQPLPQEIYDNGVRAETIELRREQPHLKSTGFIGKSDAERKHIAREGIFEALLVQDGQILEGMTSNFFYVRDHRAERSGAKSKRAAILCTARTGILPGITRENVIEIARGRGLDVKYRALRKDQLTTLSEAFITSSSRGIVPVVRIDDVIVGEGRPGSITKELLSAYEPYVIEKAEKI